jgi:hypothetical protein
VACNYHYLGWVLAKNYSNPSMFTKLSHKQESVTADSRYFYIPHRYRGEIKIYIIKYGGSRDMWLVIIIILDGFLHGNI